MSRSKAVGSAVSGVPFVVRERPKAVGSLSKPPCEWGSDGAVVGWRVPRR
jgi:hypothetical protein